MSDVPYEQAGDGLGRQEYEDSVTPYRHYPPLYPYQYPPYYNPYWYYPPLPPRYPYFHPFPIVWC